jgi:nucleotide-binding universal stress UspA family protein
VDYSEHARDAIRHAKEIAAAYGASIELLHVFEEVPRPEFYDSVGFSLDVIKLGAKKEAKKEMQRLYESSAGPDVDVKYHTTTGRAGEEIVCFAKETGVDLIVIATHGLSGMWHLLMGSVAEKVVRAAPCPVFTVKSFGKTLLGESMALGSVRTGIEL